MEKIKTPLATLERKGDEIKIVSTLAGTVATVSVKQLQSWAISQLRKVLVDQKS